MLAAVFRFHGELNDFLAHARRQADISVRFNHDQSVKHLIESLGVPHTQVGRVLVSGQQVDFSYLMRDGDRVEVYPLSIEDRSGEQLGEPRFVVDIHLGRLAVYLRMLGFDTLYRNDYDDDELAQTAGLDERILLTRDQRLLMRNQVRRGYWVRSKIPREQIVEVLRRFRLWDQVVPFNRCMRCNGFLQPVEKEAVLHRLEPLTKKYYDQFRICSDCSQVYWQGSHYERMANFIDQVVEESKGVAR
jgi:uncharacterized protein